MKRQHLLYNGQSIIIMFTQMVTGWVGTLTWLNTAKEWKLLDTSGPARTLDFSEMYELLARWIGEMRCTMGKTRNRHPHLVRGIAEMELAMLLIKRTPDREALLQVKEGLKKHGLVHPACCACGTPMKLEYLKACNGDSLVTWGMCPACLFQNDTHSLSERNDWVVQENVDTFVKALDGAGVFPS